MSPRVPLLSLALLLVLATQTWAHGFFLEVHAEGDEICGEAYFSDGDPPSAGTWRVFAGAEGGDEGQGAPLGEGPLDAQGRFRFRSPAPGAYRCEVDETVGLHRASASLTLAPFPEATPPASGASAALPAPGAGAESRAEEQRAEAARRRGARGWGRGRLKRLLTGFCAIALLGFALYRFQRRRQAPPGEDPEDES